MARFKLRTQHPVAGNKPVAPVIPMTPVTVNKPRSPFLSPVLVLALNEWDSEVKPNFSSFSGRVIRSLTASTRTPLRGTTIHSLLNYPIE